MVKLDARLIRKAVPRVLKAAVWGFLTYTLVYYLPLTLLASESLPFRYTTWLFQFAVMAIFFAVVGALFSGTIIGYGLGIARAIIIIAFFFAVSDSGILNMTLPFMEVPVNLTVDISIILLMIVSVYLFDIAKNLLEAITILNQKATEIDFT